VNVVICDAIRARRLMRFVYEGYERVVEPHLYGVNSAGHEAVSAYLVRGWSASETAPGWRTYLVDQMRDTAALADAFEGSREGYNPDDTRMQRIHCRIEPEPGPGG
jgi:hypothetical protein